MRLPVRMVPGRPVREGAGVRNIVTIGGEELPDLDPFLLLAEFGGEDPIDYRGGFPQHPHRGFETLTYVIEGRLAHADSRGNAGRLASGAVQRMKAGRGLLHAEMPDQADGPLRAVQIWLNLPARDKMDEPSYQDVAAEAIPVHRQDGATVRILVGNAFGLASPIVGGATDLVFLDVELARGAAVTIPLPGEHVAVGYLLDGHLHMDGHTIVANTAVLLSPGRALTARSGEPARFLLLAARAIGEPVARRGPFVMNTREEIEEAFADYQAGRFGM